MLKNKLSNLFTLNVIGMKIVELAVFYSKPPHRLVFKILVELLYKEVIRSFMN